MYKYIHVQEGAEPMRMALRPEYNCLKEVIRCTMDALLKGFDGIKGMHAGVHSETG